MFFTLNRTEENKFAVLIDDSGKVYVEELTLLPENCRIGDVFILESGVYVTAVEETAERKRKLKEKRDNFFNKLKKELEEI